MPDKRSIYLTGYRWLGILLIVLGLLGLVDQFFNVRFGHFTWPLFILVPGVIMLMLPARAIDQPAEPLAMLGGMVTMLGLLLSYQNLTGHWASWAYAWALVAPTGVGLGQLIYGTNKGLPNKVRSGRDLIAIGLGITAVGFIFFELVLNIGGLNLGIAGWGVLLILLGAFTLLRPFGSQKV